MTFRNALKNKASSTWDLSIIFVLLQIVSIFTNVYLVKGGRGQGALRKVSVEVRELFMWGQSLKVWNLYRNYVALNISINDVCAGPQV